MTGWYDIGQLAHLDAGESGEAGDDDEQVKDDGEDRPADKQSGKADGCFWSVAHAAIP